MKLPELSIDSDWKVGYIIGFIIGITNSMNLEVVADNFTEDEFVEFLF